MLARVRAGALGLIAKDCRLVDLDPEDIKKFIRPQPIPEILHSVYEEGPFRTCNVCGAVLTDGRLYEIQKVYRGEQVVFELAICDRCGETVSREFSEESMEKIKRHLLENFKPSDDAGHCHFCGFPRALIHNFTIVGACTETSLILPSIIMCDNCSESIQELLSRKTRDAHDDFVRDNFPGVPADLDLSPSFGPLLG